MRTRGRSAVAAGTVIAAFVTLASAACGTAGSAAGGARPASATARPASAIARPAPQRGLARSASAAPTSPATPTGAVPPTGSAPPAGPEETGCPGLPSGAAEALPASFTPVSVLRCVTGNTTVPGKGDWMTATLEKASGQDLAPLDRALHVANGQRQAGVACPLYVIAPPQIALVGADGTTIRPRFPVTGCGQIQPQVTTALNALRWQTVSRRLIAPADQ